MSTINLSKASTWQKWFFKLPINDVTISLLIVLGFFLSELPGVESGEDVLAEFLFLLNYIIGIGIINYWLLPRFFNAKWWWVFLLSCLVVTTMIAFVEEIVLERIFYPKAQGKDSFTYDSISHVAVDFLPPALFFFGFKLFWNYQKEQIDIRALRQEKTESELNFLRSQLNPHVLFNNLNNIYSYALDASPKAPEMILKLSDIMRYMLYECDGAFVPLQKEVTYLENYIELQKTQMEGRGEVNFKIVGETGGYRIAPLLLIAFVENSFKHSMQSQVKDIQIDITLRIIEGHFDFFVENTYSKDTEKSELPGGIGLDNVKKRLALIYPDRHELHRSQGKNVFWINLKIELI